MAEMQKDCRSNPCLPPAAFVHPCTAHMGGAVAKGMLQFVDHQAVAVAAQTLQRDGGARHTAAQAFQLAAIAGLGQATAALSEKPSRAAVKGFGCCTLSRAAAEVCRRSVLRPAMGPTAMR